MIWRHMFCKHEWAWARNIYGDEINLLNARSIWRCSKCSKMQYRGELFEEGRKSEEQR